jgi:hypothetical protein
MGFTDMSEEPVADFSPRKRGQTEGKQFNTEI